MGRTPWSDRSTVEGGKSLSASEMMTKEALDVLKLTEWWRKVWTSEKYLEVFIKYWWTKEGRKIANIYYEVKRSETGSIYVQLSYIRTFAPDEEITYPVELTTTPCNFGGVRYWFLCPLVVDGKACRRRVGKLYLPWGSRYFGCRTCHDLTYRSCKEHNKVDRERPVEVSSHIEIPPKVVNLLKVKESLFL